MRRLKVISQESSQQDPRINPAPGVVTALERLSREPLMGALWLILGPRPV